MRELAKAMGRRQFLDARNRESAEDLAGRWRTAIGVGARPAAVGSGLFGDGGMRMDMQRRQGRLDQRERGRGWGGEAGEARALVRRSENVFRAGKVGKRGVLRAHCAMVRSVAAAAGGQARFISARQQCRERRQPEQDDQRNGQPAPHLDVNATRRLICGV